MKVQLRTRHKTNNTARARINSIGLKAKWPLPCSAANTFGPKENGPTERGAWRECETAEERVGGGDDGGGFALSMTKHESKIKSQHEET